MKYTLFALGVALSFCASHAQSILEIERAGGLVRPMKNGLSLDYTVDVGSVAERELLGGDERLG